MINLFALKQKAQAEAAAGIDRKQKKQPAQLRVEKGTLRAMDNHGSIIDAFLWLDISELDIPKTIRMSFPDPEDQMHFHLAISPDEGPLVAQGCSIRYHSSPPLGFYEGGVYQFSVHVKDAYPHEPPKVLCQQKVSLWFSTDLGRGV